MGGFYGEKWAKRKPTSRSAYFLVSYLDYKNSPGKGIFRFAT